MKQLSPIQIRFKLYMDGKHVGFEEHGNGLIYHALKKSEWIPNPQYMPIIIGAEVGNFYIKHDEKRQCTIFSDMHGFGIALGDKLIYPDYPEAIHVVEFVYTSFDHGWLTIGAKTEMGSQVESKHFEYMELVEEIK